MDDTAVYLTPEGKVKLEKELHQLVNVQRVDLAKRLHFAIKQGDLSENADYQAAKEEQAFMEGRILELRQILRNAVLIEQTGGDDGRVRLGSHVTVLEAGYEDRETYHLVGATEADPAKGRISNESPLGRALLGRVVGDRVSVRAPAGTISFEIVDVS
jgi:transcription elongation factor GreA